MGKYMLLLSGNVKKAIVPRMSWVYLKKIIDLGGGSLFSKEFIFKLMRSNL